MFIQAIAHSIVKLRVVHLNQLARYNLWCHPFNARCNLPHLPALRVLVIGCDGNRTDADHCRTYRAASKVVVLCYF